MKKKIIMFISPRCVDAGVLSDDGHAGGYNDDGDILWSTDATHETCPGVTTH